MVVYDHDDVTPYIKRWVTAYEHDTITPILMASHRAPFRSALSVLKHVRSKVLGEALGNVLMKRRTECATVLALMCKPEEIISKAKAKTLIYTSNVEPLILLDGYLKKLKFLPILATGATEVEFNRAFAQFDTNPELNPILATFDFLREGVPITAANTIVLINRPFRQYVWEQVIARALRLGQKNQVYIIEVTLDTGTEPNISQRMDMILTTIRQSIKELIGSEFAGPTNVKMEVLPEIDHTTIESEEMYTIPDTILPDKSNIK